MPWPPWGSSHSTRSSMPPVAAQRSTHPVCRPGEGQGAVGAAHSGAGAAREAVMQGRCAGAGRGRASLHPPCRRRQPKIEGERSEAGMRASDTDRAAVVHAVLCCGISRQAPSLLRPTCVQPRAPTAPSPPTSPQVAPLELRPGAVQRVRLCDLEPQDAGEDGHAPPPVAVLYLHPLDEPAGRRGGGGHCEQC